MTPRQARAAKLEAKRLKMDCDGRYKEAFKDATNLVAASGVKAARANQFRAYATD